MKIRKVTATFTQKWGLPDYSNFEIFASMQADTEPREDARACIAALTRLCKHQVEAAGEQKLKEYYDRKEATKAKINGILNDNEKTMKTTFIPKRGEKA